jgi:hypothetical protein
MLRLFLIEFPSMDKIGCAMVIFLPGFDFLLPDTIFLYRRRTMGMI